MAASCKSSQVPWPLLAFDGSTFPSTPRIRKNFKRLPGGGNSNGSSMGLTLPNKRVIQRDLVYVIGLAPTIAEESILMRQEYFGQYGNIKKLVVNHSKPFKTPKGLSYSAYINFSNEVEASLCIKACNNFTLFNRVLKVTFGTTKYCSFFLRGQKCHNKDCTYLHVPGNRNDYFTKDELLYKHIEPQNSLFSYLDINVFHSDKCVLPCASLTGRQRYFSEDIFREEDVPSQHSSGELKKERLYSVDLSPPKQHYRRAFILHSDEEPPRMPPLLKKLIDENEVSENHSVIDAAFAPLLQDEAWAQDLLKIEANSDKLLVKPASN